MVLKETRFKRENRGAINLDLRNNNRNENRSFTFIISSETVIELLANSEWRL